jgi:hypothetical protein
LWSKPEKGWTSFEKQEKKHVFKDKINGVKTYSKNKSIRILKKSVTIFKKSYQPKTNVAKDKKGDLPADCHNIFNRWKDCSQL